MHTYPGPTLATWAQYVAISAFHANSLRRRRCKPTAHCNESREMGGAPLPRKLRPALQHLKNPVPVPVRD